MKDHKTEIKKEKECKHPTVYGFFSQDKDGFTTRHSECLTCGKVLYHARKKELVYFSGHKITW